MSELLEIHFTGENISPENIRIGEIAVILESLENVLLSVILEQHPALTKEALTIGLHNINHGSLGLQFTSQLPEVVTPAFHKVAEAVIAGVGDGFSKESNDNFEKILNFVKRHDAQADFIVVNGHSETIATLTSSFVIPKPTYINGQTTIYGQIVRVGGVEPKVEVKTISGQTIFCPFDVSLASELGALLYQLAGLNGLAKWDAQTFEIQEFRVTSISNFRDTSVVEAFQSLTEIAGEYYDDVEDVRSYIESLRRGD